MFITIYFIILFLIALILLKINSFHLFNESLIFSICTNYLLILSFFLFFYYFENSIFSLINSILLFFFTVLLIHDFKKVLGYIPVASLFYLIANILLIIVCL